ncbi:hypothetical protein ACWC09_15920 [Streptomyces sp. NPDC001617]
MSQPELTPLPSATTHPRPGFLGRALGVLFFGLALAAFWFGLHNAALATGLAGRHGILAVDRCWVEGGHRHSKGTSVCGGTFRSDDGKVVDDQASAWVEVKPGSKVSVRKAGDWYVQVGFVETVRWLSLFFLGLIVLAFGMVFAATGRFPRSGRQVVLITRAASETRVGVVRKWMVRGGLFGVGACLLVMLSFRLHG